MYYPQTVHIHRNFRQFHHKEDIYHTYQPTVLVVMLLLMFAAKYLQALILNSSFHAYASMLCAGHNSPVHS